ncbi:serine hydrolase domain-containing protein [Brevibacillus sp. SYSU BS000544]|uniref:serine hydrolase domain-containing protein n=1 Tax=Brevibacillus sp. SYSU BS000544 TaxID=3416443 RepID=UPI003CE58FD4
MNKNDYLTKVIYCFLIVLLGLSMMDMSAFAEGASKGAESLEKTVDRYMEKSLTQNKIAGATVVVVKDGNVLLKKGYGFADVEHKIPVDADKTLFPIGSVTKLFTATAAMQLVDEGKIDLNADIQTYLKDVKIENKYGTPLTMRHLLTQTGGFEESINGVYSEQLLNQPAALDGTIKNHLPKLVRRPGEVIQYSNHGYALIGYIVERVSGMPFDQYVQEKIFQPLQMSNSSYFLSPEILPRTTKGFAYENEGFTPKQLGSILVHPAGSICATAEDMSKFILAHLQDGKYGEARILQEKTAKDMKSLQFTSHPMMPGYGYGFYQSYKNRNIMLHDGDTDYFTSQLSLLPEKNLGYFISYNTQDDGLLRDGFEEELYKFFGVELQDKISPTTQAIPANATSNEDIKKFDGDYVFAQRLLEGPLKIRGLFLKTSIETDEKGDIHLKVFDTSLNGKYERVDQNLFVNKETNKLIYLKEGSEGNKYLTVNMKVPLQTLVKLSPSEVFMESYIRPFIFAVSFIGCLIGFFQLFRRRKTKKYEGVALRAKRISSLICLFILLFGISLILIMFTQSDDFRQNVLIAVNVIITILAAGVVLSSISLAYVTRQRLLPFWNIGFYTCVMFAGIGAISYAYFLDLFLL